MDYRYTSQGWHPITPPVPYSDESIGVDLATGGYVLLPTDSTATGAVCYFDADGEYPYATDVSELAGRPVVIWVSDLPALARLSAELGSLKTLLGVS